MEAKLQVHRQLGLRKVVAILPFQLNITLDTNKAIAMHIVRAQDNRSAQRAAAMIEDNNVVKLQPLQTKGKANWSSAIQKMEKGIYSQSSTSSEAGTLGEQKQNGCNDASWNDAGGRQQWQRRTRCPSAA